MPNHVTADDAYIRLFGAVISQAIEDYKELNGKVDKLLLEIRSSQGQRRSIFIEKLLNYYSAKAFLFQDDYLLSWLEEYGYENLEINMIRFMANKALTVKDIPNEVDAFTSAVDIKAAFDVLGIKSSPKNYPVIFVLENDDGTEKVWGIKKENAYESNVMMKNYPDWDSTTEVELLYEQYR